MGDTGVIVSKLRLAEKISWQYCEDLSRMRFVTLKEGKP